MDVLEERFFYSTIEQCVFGGVWVRQREREREWEEQTEGGERERGEERAAHFYTKTLFIPQSFSHSPFSESYTLYVLVMCSRCPALDTNPSLSSLCPTCYEDC